MNFFKKISAGARRVFHLCAAAQGEADHVASQSPD